MRVVYLLTLALVASSAKPKKWKKWEKYPYKCEACRSLVEGLFGALTKRMEEEISENDRTKSKGMDPMTPFEIADHDFCEEEFYTSKVPADFQVPPESHPLHPHPHPTPPRMVLCCRKLAESS
jgi:hypothetical protein